MTIYRDVKLNRSQDQANFWGLVVGNKKICFKISDSNSGNAFFT